MVCLYESYDGSLQLFCLMEKEYFLSCLWEVWLGVHLTMSRMFQEYASSSMLEAIALKAAMIMLSLLLQHYHHQSKLKENLCCLEKIGAEEGW